jgi:ubiquitin-conjugating enzyme E2 D/E
MLPYKIGMSSHCIRRIQKEVRELPFYQTTRWIASPRGGYDLLNWEATIQNLDDPRHRGKKYRLSIEVPGNYPFVAPRIRFIDRVHCENVFYDGELCLDILNDQWSPAYTLWSLLEAIASVLTDKPVSGLVNKIRTTNEIANYNIIPQNDIIQPVQRRRRRTELELLMS